MDGSGDDDGRGAGPAPTLLATDAVYGRRVGSVRRLIALGRICLDLRRRPPPPLRAPGDGHTSVRVDVEGEDPADDIMIW